MSVFLARQPVISEHTEIFGFELFYREGSDNFHLPSTDYDATKLLIEKHNLHYGVSHVTKGKKAMINFSEVALLRGVAQALNPAEVVIEILETVPPSDEVFEACKELIRLGYELALDDFIYSPEWDRFLNIVHIVKIDIIETPLHTVKDLIRNVQKIKKKSGNKSPRLLAEKIESELEYQTAKAMGFEYFQGFYFGQPEMIIHSLVNRKVG